MKPIRNMRELELVKENLNYKILHLEGKMADHAENTVDAVTHRVRELAFETGMKIILNLFFKKDNEEESTK